MGGSPASHPAAFFHPRTPPIDEFCLFPAVFWLVGWLATELLLLEVQKGPNVAKWVETGWPGKFWVKESNICMIAKFFGIFAVWIFGYPVRLLPAWDHGVSQQLSS